MRRGSVWVMMVMMALSAAGTARAMDGEYSADMVVESAGQPPAEGKIYVAQGKMRFDSAMGGSITRQDLNVTWMLMPAEQLYVEQAFDTTAVRQTSAKVPGELERQPLGKETIDGSETDKYLVTYEEGGQRLQMHQWLGPEGSPRKVAAIDGSWSVLFRNFKPGAPPAEVFEIPAGYQKMAIPKYDDMAALIEQAREAAQE